MRVGTEGGRRGREDEVECVCALVIYNFVDISNDFSKSSLITISWMID